ncbi:hypothetical protein AX17_004796 [Amanita inopinata Kibby_2008]|nr:hypothetical protein AX17_004796 [Amanita inopinata Kibby_2008]
MRFSTPFLAFLHVLISTPILAIHPHVLSHRSQNPKPPSRTLARLQYHAPRALIDTCISLDAATAVKTISDLPLVGPLLTPLVISAVADLCLCLKDLDIYLDTDSNAEALVNVLGKDATAVLLTAIIDTSPSSRHCTMPPHARRTCNNSDPCHWACEDGFTRQGDVCICPLEKRLCNGKCGDFTEGCGASPVPRSMKKLAITTFTRAKATCRTGEAVCGIPGREGTLGFECIDVDNSLDSCGGCMSAHSFPGDMEQVQQLGKDCSQLPNVLEVECTKRTCLVHRCKDGFKPNENQDACILGDTVPSLMTRMKRHQKRDDTVTTDTVLYVGTNFLDQLAILVDLTLKLNLDWTSLGTSAFAQSTVSRYETRINHTVVYPILEGLARLLKSPTVSSLVSNTDAFVDVILSSSRALDDCNCVNNLGLHQLSLDLEAILVASVDLSRWIVTNSVGVVAPPRAAGNQNMTVNNGSDMPVVLDLSRLLSKFGLGMIHSKTTVDGLGNGLSSFINSLLDGLGIGPSGATKRAAFRLNPNTLRNTGTLMDLILRLVMDTNAAMMSDVPSDSATKALSNSVLQDSVTDIVQATVALVNSAVNDQVLTVELSTLVDASEKAKYGLEASQPASAIVPILVDLDQILGLLMTMRESESLTSSYDGAVADLQPILDELAIKGHRIDAAVDNLGLTTNLWLSLNSLLADLGL